MQRQELQAKLLTKTLRSAEASRVELERLEREVRAEVVKLEGHAALEEEFGLGLPRITFDDSVGTVTLGWPPRMDVPSGDDVTVRTVSIEFDAHGRLVHAAAHASLEMRDEERAAVAGDDLAHLLTLVWDRVRQKHEGAQSGDNSHPDRKTRDLSAAQDVASV